MPSRTSQSASLRDAARTLSGKNQATGEKVKGCHLRAASCRAGNCSVAPVAQNEFSLNSAIADQPQEQVEQGESASLSVENQVSGLELKADHEGEDSTLPVPKSEKWSHEAIVARSNMRPERMQKLKVAGNSGQNPGVDFLQEYWENDYDLVDIIKKVQSFVLQLWSKLNILFNSSQS